MLLSHFKIHYLLKLLAFWIFYFLLFRILFVFYHHAQIPAGHTIDTAWSFLYGFRLDVSTACMFVFFPFLFIAFHQFNLNKTILKINRIYHYITISVVGILSIANIKMYGEWGTLLDARALKFLLYPKDALSFISYGALFALLFSCLLFSGIGIVLYNKFIRPIVFQKQHIKQLLLKIIIVPIVLFIGIRGGLQLSPINESNSYYSHIQINNLIATNNIWYLGHSLLDANDQKNPYHFIDANKAEMIKKELFKTDTIATKPILKNTRPNIVFIVLESWTADIVKQLGGEENVTPHFDALSKEGLLFTQMYGSGFRTEQGLISIFSGFPAQPNNSIITTPSKAEKLPSLPADLAEQGYHLSFYYGGEIEFANMKSYLLTSSFEKIVDKKDFKKEELNSKWGAHDEFVFSKQLDGLASEKEPFCSVILTLSSHEPFEVTMQTPFTGDTEAEKFKKAAYYSDYCLYAYFEKAKKEKWYNNTIFILLGDHGHRLPKNRDMNSAESKRITAFITGGALVDSLRGTTMDKICNQNDIATTLLKQMNLDHSRFNWSKDLFNPSTKAFAYYSNENALGWITPQQNITYFFASKAVYVMQPKVKQQLNDTITNQAKAYLQSLYQQYLDY
jgi:phosphoglycerol transferase MdoB-like AlkP superfamily enzyme